MSQTRDLTVIRKYDHFTLIQSVVVVLPEPHPYLPIIKGGQAIVDKIYLCRSCGAQVSPWKPDCCNHTLDVNEDEEVRGDIFLFERKVEDLIISATQQNKGASYEDVT